MSTNHLNYAFDLIDQGSRAENEKKNKEACSLYRRAHVQLTDAMNWESNTTKIELIKRYSDIYTKRADTLEKETVPPKNPTFEDLAKKLSTLENKHNELQREVVKDVIALWIALLAVFAFCGYFLVTEKQWMIDFVVSRTNK